jgi:hypothetical protein
MALRLVNGNFTDFVLNEYNSTLVDKESGRPDKV